MGQVTYIKSELQTEYEETQELQRQLEQARKTSEYYKQQAAKERQRAENERNTPRHELKNGRIKMFSSWLSERLGLEVQAVRRSIYRLAELDIIDADLSETFNQKQENGPPIAITIWYLGLYDNTIDRLMEAMKVAPRNHGGSRVWCPDCAKEVNPIIRRKGHERQICPGCERTLRESDYDETISIGKVTRKETNVQDHAKERSERKSKAKHLVTVPEDVDFPTDLDDLPLSEMQDNHHENGNGKRVSLPDWLTPGTKDWQKQVERNGLRDMMERRNAALQQKGIES